ncbi:Hypothetical protein W5S_4458 [Pectobacterium parmentieri]|uniref:Uncharacterized protein n=1 Tax=Pectobacterium parmentieri TaxID=1905730 RepID=A0A0H3IBT5_PECPM|nr:Hypothetical protein W5S_4458 [Pectobacterium parmentieri]
MTIITDNNEFQGLWHKFYKVKQVVKGGENVVF